MANELFCQSANTASEIEQYVVSRRPYGFQNQFASGNGRPLPKFICDVTRYCKNDLLGSGQGIPVENARSVDQLLHSCTRRWSHGSFAGEETNWKNRALHRLGCHCQLDPSPMSALRSRSFRLSNLPASDAQIQGW